mmetsp:Transcript_25747/g.36379  ORF Transcript_25747/g.36379 Transcript_25747/m.36379 type:complete len:247 (+) Transcript_25747:109-849(+)
MTSLLDNFHKSMHIKHPPKLFALGLGIGIVRAVVFDTLRRFCVVRTKVFATRNEGLAWFWLCLFQCGWCNRSRRVLPEPQHNLSVTVGEVVVAGRHKLHVTVLSGELNDTPIEVGSPFTLTLRRDASSIQESTIFDVVLSSIFIVDVVELVLGQTVVHVLAQKRQIFGFINFFACTRAETSFVSSSLDVTRGEVLARIGKLNQVGSVSTGVLVGIAIRGTTRTIIATATRIVVAASPLKVNTVTLA